MERIDRNTWRTDNGDEVRAQGLTVTVEFGERTKAEVLCAVEDVRAENAKLRDLIADMSKAFLTLDIDHCQACPRDKASRRCQMFATTDGECAFVTEMRKLGIEVDG